MKTARSMSLPLAASALAALALVAPASSATIAHASKQKIKAPLLKSLIYTPLTTKGEDGFLQARFTATVKLYHSAPSISFMIKSVSSHNIETEATPEKSYSAGVHKVSFIGDALPGGTYKITLYEAVRPPAGSLFATSIKSSDPATLVVQEERNGVAGAGTVTKI